MAKRGFFNYSCNYYDEFTEKMEFVKGIVYADTYENAAYELEHFYEYISDIRLEGLEPGPPVYQFKEEKDG